MATENPFEAPKAAPAQEAAAPIEPSVEALDVDDAPPSPNVEQVELTATASLLEAEMLASRLRGSGIRVALRDHQTVGANAFLSPIVGGVKVIIAKADLERAQPLLEHKRPGEPIFIVFKRPTVSYGVLGLLLGLGAGVLAMVLFGFLPLLVVLAIAGLVEGIRRGSRGMSYCGSCFQAMKLEMKTCPRCEGTVAGVVNSARERMEAEERLREQA